MKKDFFTVYFSVGGLLVLGGLIWGFWAVGSPLEARALKLDDRRIQDISSLSYQLDEFYRTHKKTLPVALDELSNPVPKDPESDANYSYEKLANDRYKLCATFLRTTNGEDPRTKAPYYDPYSQQGDWSHAAGETCFTREIRPDAFAPDAYPRSYPVD